MQTLYASRQLLRYAADHEQICVYSNIRFASPPLGDLRFKAPKYPPDNKLPLPSSAPSCIQAKQDKCLSALPFDETPGCFPDSYGSQSEDCLFLDVYVPKQAFSMSKPLPVIVWFYGGAYLFGSKTFYDPSVLPFYDGGPLVDRANALNKPEHSVIFVRG
jgi:carboxylesterase type B